MKIKDFMYLKGLKQIAVAKRAGIDPSQLSKFLHGWIGLKEEHLKSLSKTLGVPLKAVKSDDINGEITNG